MSFLQKTGRGILCAALLTASLSLSAAALTGVTSDPLRLRSEPNTQCQTLAVAPRGARVEILQQQDASGWYQVSYGGLTGYMSGDYISLLPEQQKQGRVATGNSVLNVRSGPGTEYAVLGKLRDGTPLFYAEGQEGWYQIQYAGTVGYVSAQYLQPIEATPPGTATEATPQGGQVVAMAQKYLGAPYVYGGAGPNRFDCSGFTYYIYKQLGVSINRTASAQLNNGVAVSTAALLPGDLVFFRYRTTAPASHVGIYVGNGQFIHASTNRYVVQYDDLTSGHYANVLIGARRIF